MSDITNELSYETTFTKKIASSGNTNWQEEALKCALDIRKFEIELYWKRATYFWTLIAAAFAGYFALQNVEVGKRNEASIFIISCIGVTLSFAWYLVNRGSKYWQENWERHVDVLADKVIGPLYRTTLSREAGSLLKLHAGFPFSVSRINQVVSLFVTVLWSALAVHAFPFSQAIRPSRIAAYWSLAAFTVVFLFLLLWLGWPKKTSKRRPIRFDIAEFEDESPNEGKIDTSNFSTSQNTQSTTDATKQKVIDKERKKRLFVMLWLLLSAFVLWLMSMVQMQSFDLGSFIWFASFLFGGSVAYHFLTEMLKTPINSENDERWNTTIKYSLLSACAVLTVVGIGFFEKYVHSFGGALVLLGILSAIWIVCGFAEKALKVFPKTG